MRQLTSMLALLTIAVPCVAHAARPDGRSARAAVLQSLAAQKSSTRNIRVHAIGSNPRSTRVLVENTASKTVREMSYRNGVARDAKDLIAQATAKGEAHQLLHRDAMKHGAPILTGYVKFPDGTKVPQFAYKKRAGTYSGESKSGLSANGNSMVFTSKTDRHAATADRVLVSVRTGEARLFKN